MQTRELLYRKILSHLCHNKTSETSAQDASLDSVDTNISDALELYIRLKGAGRDHLFACITNT